MTKYRNIRVKMKGGKTRIQRAMVLASGKLRFVKGKGHKRRSDRRKRGSVRGKKDYTFTAARRRAAKRNIKKAQRASRRRAPKRRRRAPRRRQTRRRRLGRKIKRLYRSGGGITFG